MSGRMAYSPKSIVSATCTRNCMRTLLSAYRLACARVRCHLKATAFSCWLTKI